MGLAAWVRAVALPLSALSLGYWLACRSRRRRALGLTAAGLAAALVVLSPWALQHLKQSGALYFTDDHGGITALIGANPNSEGTYTRALNQMFKDVTGRSVLDEPHHATDEAAYAIVRDWTPLRAALHAGPRRAQGRPAVRSGDPSSLLADLPPRRPDRPPRRLVRRAPRRHRVARRRVWPGGDGADAGGNRRGDRAAALGAAGAPAVSARARGDLHDLLRGAALPAADRAAGLSLCRARARRARGPRGGPWCRARARSRPFVVGARRGAGRRRDLAFRLADAARRRPCAARAPSLGGHRGRTGWRPPGSRPRLALLWRPARRIRCPRRSKARRTDSTSGWAPTVSRARTFVWRADRSPQGSTPCRSARRTRARRRCASRAVTAAWRSTGASPPRSTSVCCTTAARSSSTSALRGPPGRFYLARRGTYFSFR